LYIPDSNKLFQALLKNKGIVESDLGHELEWMELEGKKASRIVNILDIDVENSDNWENGFMWLMNTAQDFQAVFAEQIRKMNI
ncbi:MAG: DUF4268 domain-containing protein, partial [Candidatus Aegiribacteria sp.]|nr:DUF4268 domain-containing protein [Candidatus Aegiribacteria sp.]